MKLVKLLFFLFFITILTSCSKQAPEVEEEDAPKEKPKWDLDWNKEEEKPKEKTPAELKEEEIDGLKEQYESMKADLKDKKVELKVLKVLSRLLNAVSHGGLIHHGRSCSVGGVLTAEDVVKLYRQLTEYDSQMSPGRLAEIKARVGVDLVKAGCGFVIKVFGGEANKESCYRARINMRKEQIDCNKRIAKIRFKMPVAKKKIEQAEKELKRIKSGKKRKRSKKKK